jgi:alpha-beta hydrolase superfamily lysophospholipase
VISGSELPGVDNRFAVASTRFAIEGNRGLRLAARRWQAERARGVVLFAHGYTAHMDSYANVIDVLIKKRFHVLAIDHRGHGASEGKRASLDRFDDMVDDFERLAGVARATHPGLPIFTLGHSMGGLIVARHALQHQEHLAGMVSVSAAYIVGEHVSERTVKALLTVSRFLPTLPLIGEGSIVAEDGDNSQPVPEQPEVRKRDIFSYHGRTRLNMARELRLGGLDALDRMPGLTVPVLFQHGTLDKVTSPQGSIQAFQNASSEDRSIELWEYRRHNLLTDDGWEDVMIQLNQWLVART